MFCCCYKNTTNSQALENCISLTIIKDRHDVSKQNFPVSFHPVVTGDTVGLSLGSSLWQEDWEKLPAKAKLGPVNVVKNGVWACTTGGRSWSRSFGAWVVATELKSVQTQASTLLSQPRGYSLAPAGSRGVRQRAGVPFAAPHAALKKLNKDFSFRAVSLVSLQEHILSSLSPISLFLIDK